MLTIFYDSHCPLCAAEMRHLKQFDRDGQIDLVDLHQTDFESLYPEISFDKAMQILHGQYRGKLLLGLQVTHRAWTIVGKGFWVAPLNWPIIKTISHWCYLVLAKYRHPISAGVAKLFNLDNSQCISGTCYDKQTNSNNRRK